MSAHAIVPPATLGILGGGQLGRYAVMAAASMGYRTIVLDPDPSAPAGLLAHEHLVAGHHRGVLGLRGDALRAHRHPGVGGRIVTATRIGLDEGTSALHPAEAAPSGFHGFADRLHHLDEGLGGRREGSPGVLYHADLPGEPLMPNRPEFKTNLLSMCGSLKKYPTARSLKRSRESCS